MGQVSAVAMFACRVAPVAIETDKQFIRRPGVIGRFMAGQGRPASEWRCPLDSSDAVTKPAGSDVSRLTQRYADQNKPHVAADRPLRKAVLNAAKRDEHIAGMRQISRKKINQL